MKSRPVARLVSGCVNCFVDGAAMTCMRLTKRQADTGGHAVDVEGRSGDVWLSPVHIARAQATIPSSFQAKDAADAIQASRDMRREPRVLPAEAQAKPRQKPQSCRLNSDQLASGALGCGIERMRIMIFTIAFVLAWLWMTRICLRWTIELERPLAKYSNAYMLVVCLVFWPLGLWQMWSEYAAKSGKRVSHRMALQKLAGESRWHRRERLERAHHERCEDLDIPEA